MALRRVVGKGGVEGQEGMGWTDGMLTRACERSVSGKRSGAGGKSGEREWSGERVLKKIT